MQPDGAVTCELLFQSINFQKYLYLYVNINVITTFKFLIRIIVICIHK